VAVVLVGARRMEEEDSPKTTERENGERATIHTITTIRTSVHTRVAICGENGGENEW
jgi:hypothetical protein